MSPSSESSDRLFPSLRERGYLGCELAVFELANETQFLRFDDGVTAIFGQNGVGKSRTLARLRALLSRSSALRGEYIYMHTDGEREMRVSQPFEDSTAIETVYDHARALALPIDQVTAQVASWFCGSRNVAQYRELGVRDIAEGVALEPSLAIELAAHKTFGIIPGPSGWYVAAAIPPDLAPGPLRNELDQLRALVETENWSSLDGDEWDPYPLAHAWVNSLATALSHSDRPAWAPAAMEFAGEAERWLVSNVLDLDPNDRSRLPIGDDMDPDTDDDTVNLRGALASELFAVLYLDAFPLVIDMRAPDEWIQGRLPEWLAQDRSLQGGAIRLSALSDTQERWASLAIRLADAISSQRKVRDDSDDDHRGCPLTIIADEPERGMSVLAQRHLSRGMNNLSRRFGVDFFVATHSASIIEDPSTNLVSAYRDAQFHLKLAEVDPVESGVFANLGVPHWELPHLYRTILFVEGAHDEAIIDQIIGGELARDRIKILPLRGAGKQLVSIAADADFLIQHTTAGFVVLLDNASGGPFNEALDAAHAGASSNDVDRILTQALDKNPTQEERVLKTLLMRATESGAAARIRGIAGLPVADVIELLPSSLVSERHTWAELRELHAVRTGGPNDFKKWLEQKFKTEITPTSLRRSAADLDEVPSALLELLDICRNASDSDVARASA